jgi:phosphoribosylformylglycinamidine synthase
MMERASPTSATIDLSAWSDLPLRALLFGEAQGRVLVSTPDAGAVLAAAARHGVPAAPIGTVRARGGSLLITVAGRRIESPVSALAEAYHEAIPRIMSRAASAQDAALVSDTVV